MVEKWLENKLVFWGGISFLAVLLIVLIFSWYNSFRSGSAVEKSDLFFPVPEQTAIMVRAPSVNAVYKTFSELQKVEDRSGQVFENIKHQFVRFDSLASAFPKLKKTFLNNSFLASWHLQGESNLIFFANIHFSTLKECEKVEQIIKSRRSLVRKYSGTSIYRIPSVGYIAFWKHYFLLGETQLIIEQSLLKLNSGESIANKPELSKILHSAGDDVDANLFVNFPNLQKVLNVETSPFAVLSQLYQWGNWGGYDIDFSDKGINIRGFSSFGDKNILQLFKGQSTGTTNVLKILPTNVDCFLSFPVDDYKKYIDAYKSWLDQREKASDYNVQLRKLKQLLGMSSNTFVDTYFLGSVSLAILDRSSSDINDDKVIVMELKSGGVVNPILESATKKSKDGKVYEVVVDEGSKYTAYSLGSFDLLGTIWGSYFSLKDKGIYVVYNNLLIGATSVKKLKSFIYQNTLKRTFYLSKQFQFQKENLNQKSNLYFYANGSKSNMFLQDLFATSYGEDFEKKNQLSSTFHGMSSAIDLNDKMAYTSIFLDYPQKGMKDARTVWQSKIDAPMEFKPHFVINHNTGEKEILIQDVNNVLYLINSVGRVLWKKPLKGEIVGDVTQVDFYKNGKLQMWFATPNALHLMDRNGNEVERYPILFPSKATNGLAVFDYDKNKTYRGFIACEDNRIYAYSLDGNRVTGWSFGKTERTVSTPVQWFRYKNKDYLIFGDDYRTYIVNRRGEDIVKLQDLTPKATQSIFYMDEDKDGSIVFITTTPKGEILSIYLNGKVKLNRMGSFSGNHTFVYADVDGDGNRDFVFADDDKLSLFNYQQKQMFKISVPSTISYVPSIYTFGKQQIEVGVVCKEKGKIYLYNRLGKLHAGFPLQGQTMFTIGFLNQNDRNFSLIVGGSDNYLYNYTIN